MRIETGDIIPFDEYVALTDARFVAGRATPGNSGIVLRERSSALRLIRQSHGKYMLL